MIDRACISLNSNCNFNCKYCHFNSNVKRNGNHVNKVEKEEAQVIIKNIITYVDIKKVELFKLGIVGAGEPLLSFDEIRAIIEIIDKSIVKNNFQVYTITNGSLVNDEIMEFAYEYRNIFSMCFSLDGYRELNDKYRSSFTDVWRNIQLYRKRFGKMPQINATVTKESYLNQNRLFRFFLSNDLLNVNFSKVFGDVDEEMLVSDEQYESFLSNAKESGLIFRQDGKERRYDCTKYGRLCGVGRTNIYLSKEGVYPCARFWQNPIFFLGEVTTPFFDLEEKLKSFTPCPDYKCYYDYYYGAKV